MQRSNFDPAKIVGPYPVLGAFLLVIEAVLLLWFSRAENSFERIFAGVLMVLVFAGFLYAVVRINGQKQEESVVTPQGLGKISPASDEITAKQIEIPEPETIVSPDKTYIINRPPDDWTIKELTIAEWQAEGLGIRDPIGIQNYIDTEKLHQVNQVPEILLMKTKITDLIIPIPGKTTINGTKQPSALEIDMPTRLAIIPMRRAQPPFFVERPLTHNFHAVIGELLKTFGGLMTLYKQPSETTTKTKRQQLVAEFRQVVQNCFLNESEVKEITSHLLLIGIEGDIQDYILMMNYVLLTADDASVDPNLKVIESLINSFRPVKIINQEKQLQEFKAEDDNNFAKYMAENGKQIFFSQMATFLYRINGVDLDNPENRLRIMKQLKPFEILSEQVHLQSEQLDVFWNSLRKAESGDATEFKQMLKEWIDAATKSKDKKSEEVIMPDENLLISSNNNNVESSSEK